jgi:hypothetical protein
MSSGANRGPRRRSRSSAAPEGSTFCPLARPGSTPAACSTTAASPSVDAPPVLPVPDALTIGRWVDGAVLAVRFDASRYPLVERANQRLAAVGVPVIGAVVNGVGGSEGGYYGGYYPSYGLLDEEKSSMNDGR